MSPHPLPPLDPAADLRAAFTAAVTRHYRLLFATAYRVLPNPPDAEDAVQAGVVKALAALPTVAYRGAMVSWLVRIVHRAAQDAKRRTNPRLPDLLGDGAEMLAGGAAWGTELDGEDCRALRRAVDALPADMAEVVRLRHGEGLTTGEVGQRLGVTANLARVRLFRAYARLRADETVRGVFAGQGRRRAA